MWLVAWAALVSVTPTMSAAADGVWLSARLVVAKRLLGLEDVGAAVEADGAAQLLDRALES